MPYHIDLTKIGLETYKEKLKTAYLPPSRQMLKEKTDERFEFLASQRFENVNDLLKKLRKKDQIEKLAKAPCLSENYLKIWLREMKSMLPKPNKISDFQGINPETVSKLEKQGIKNTRQLFDHSNYPRKQTKTGRNKPNQPC